jgi:hypothetical protein
MKATYQIHSFDGVREPHEVELLKVNPDGRDSGLFLAHIRLLEDTDNYPKGQQLAVGGHDITVRAKNIHDWAKQFNQPDRSKFERDFMDWLWAQIGKPVVVECIEEPRGYRGLEGYQKGGRYMAVLGEQYCKVYPSTGDDYCELCTLPVFKRFFKEI